MKSVYINVMMRWEGAPELSLGVEVRDLGAGTGMLWLTLLGLGLKRKPRNVRTRIGRGDVLGWLH